jgi:hypothetical protein
VGAFIVFYKRLRHAACSQGLEMFISCSEKVGAPLFFFFFLENKYHQSSGTSFEINVAVGTPVVTRKKCFEADGRSRGTRNEAFRCCAEHAEHAERRSQSLEARWGPQ